MKPAFICVLMALLAVLVVHQSPLRDKVSVAGASERIFKIPLPIGRSTLAPFPWILGLRNEHRSNSKRRSDPNSLGYHPTDSGSHQPMQPIEPHGDQWGNDVSPIHHSLAERSAHEFKRPKLDQQHTADQHHAIRSFLRNSVPQPACRGG